MTSDLPPLMSPKRYDEPSRFQAENLLREARRQRRLPNIPVPDVCLLDPEGDVVRHLRATGEATRHQRTRCGTSIIRTRPPSCGHLRKCAGAIGVGPI